MEWETKFSIISKYVYSKYNKKILFCKDENEPYIETYADGNNVYNFKKCEFVIFNGLKICEIIELIDKLHTSEIKTCSICFNDEIFFNACSVCNYTYCNTCKLNIICSNTKYLKQIAKIDNIDNVEYAMSNFHEIIKKVYINCPGCRS